MGSRKKRPASGGMKIGTKRSKSTVVTELLKFGRRLKGGVGWYTYNKTDDSINERAEAFVRMNSNAWFFGVIFDQGIPFWKAWEAPYKLRQRIGHLNMIRLAKTPLSKLRRAVRGSKTGDALTRYVNTLPEWLKQGAIKISKEYRGDASNIWMDCRTAGEVIERLLEFKGISHKKAHMATRILHEGKDEYSKRFTCWSDINVAADVHLKRVWRRSGLVDSDAVEAIMLAAKELNPKYPGQLDEPSWVIGMNWCHERGADCFGNQHSEGRPCPLEMVCPKLGVRIRGS